MTDALLPPQSTRTERALAALGNQVLDIPVPNRTLWNVETCPEEMLPWLAWSFSVDLWDEAWPVSFKRGMIRNAIPAHRKKGTRQSVELALDALGIEVEIDEWWTYGGTPHTFRVDAYAQSIIAAGLPIDVRMRDTVSALIETVKPVRSQFEVRIGERRKPPLRLAARTMRSAKIATSRKVSVPVEGHAPALRAGTQHLGAMVFARSHRFTAPTGASA